MFEKIISQIEVYWAFKNEAAMNIRKIVSDNNYDQRNQIRITGVINIYEYFFLKICYFITLSILLFHRVFFG